MVLGFVPISAKPNNYADSLEVRLILVGQPEKIAVMNQLASFYLRNQPAKAQRYAKNALNLSKELGSKPGEAESLKNLGLSFKYLLSNYDSALYYCFESIKLAQENKLVPNQLETYLAISEVYREVGNNTRALSYLEDAQKIADSAKVSTYQCRVLNEKANVYLSLNEQSDALASLRKALKIAKLNNDTFEAALTGNKLGQYYLQKGDYEIALQHQHAALDIFRQWHRPRQVAQTLFYIAECYRAQGNEEKALQFHGQAVRIRLHENDKTGLAESYTKIGAVYLDALQYDEAIKYLQIGLGNALSVNGKHLIRDCYDLLYYAYTGKGDYLKASEYKDKFAEISELIYSEENERRIEQLQTKLEVEKREQAIQYLQDKTIMQQKELGRRRNFNILISVFFLIVLAFSGYIYYSYGERQKINSQLKRTNARVMDQNEELKQLNRTKDKFFSIIGHDLKGPLNSLLSFSGLLINNTESFTPAEIKTVATDVEKSLKNLRGLLENLLAWARSQTGNLEMNPEIFQLAPLVHENIQLLSHTASQKKIQLELLGETDFKVRADKNSISTVVRNLLSNAIKFTPKMGRVTVSVSQRQGEVEIAVTDNGVGIPQEARQKIFDLGQKHSTLGTNKEKGTGLGLVLCKEFVEKNGGQIAVDSKVGEGTTFRFTIPAGDTHRPPLRQKHIPSSQLSQAVT